MPPPPPIVKQIAHSYIRVGPLPFLDNVQIQADFPSLFSLCVARRAMPR